MSVELGGLGFLMALVGLGTLAVWLYALVDALRRPKDVWAAARQDQLVWVIVVVFLNLIGALVYLMVAKPTLDRAAVEVSTPVAV
jgi:hypothetical protein